jgi:hypothetical protein
MRKILLKTFFFSLLTNIAFSQTDGFTYVITDINREGVNWSSLRKIDLQSNTYSDVLFSGNDISSLAYDAASKEQLAAPFSDTRFGQAANAAFGTGVAAIAYDRKNSRLYYTPMLIDQLRYIDLKTMKVYFADDFQNSALKEKSPDQSNIITRMAFASDGNGYALTNDGKHLIQFTTGKKIKMTDLGSLVDDPSNGEVSVHQTTSFGGDMIADNDGNLYVFSAYKQVFKINISSRVAEYVGVVAGLPANFTINGAAVTKGNKILVVSATHNNALYLLDPETWSAQIIDTDQPWRSSDLANSNLLATRKRRVEPKLIKSPDVVLDKSIGLFPNPVTSKRFTVQFNRPEGNYSVVITDVAGHQVFQQVVVVSAKGQYQQLELPASTNKGVYLVKVLDKNRKAVFSQKLVVQ